MIISHNPYTGEKLKEHKEFTSEDINTTLDKATHAFSEWKQTSFSQRSGLMLKAAEELKENKQQYAETITKEMGKPISQSIAEVEKCAWVCEYYAQHAEAQLSPEAIETDAEDSYINYAPLGVVLAIMPWNYPFWQVFRFAAPALMAGNVGVLKHASNTMMCGGKIEQVFLRAGFPKGIFQNMIIGSKKVEEVLKDDRVKAVTLTGSGPAGSAVAKTAGGLIKKSVLELGGSNALVVFADADLEAAVENCVQARFQNTGQSCIAGKRLLVEEKIAADFTKLFIDKVKALKAGDPMDPNTYIGVQAREDLAKDLESQVERSVEMGAELLLGGVRKKAFFEPAVLSGVTSEMPVFNEETFGPAIGITIFNSENEAVALMNDTQFGLGVSLFTADKERAKRLIPQIEDGAVFINELVKSDPRLPFGGTKKSGYGRELSAFGIREFVNVQTIYFK
ncbi:NAD-dependent succinate-semialdehyde dehydrogenase [Salinimicrobium oceani]|uniref:NAD-dependent succinate-semialdehyde dehydrogenase n=1 Tax=Salinimicrobium oceani TaxID=2722702 RepID=A0ABX1CY46_9FLAO|nr:NAD-dependent succinate-semialdehyde dehydrogenase [Salinimicrobium oceani]NJW53195.1 NAD-dependent succinate-semialdehyde dehydrogenase [Salinimicrobium oceani]